MTDAPRYPRGWPEEWARTAENLEAVELAHEKLRGGVQKTLNDLPQHWHTKIAFRDLLTPEVRRHLKALSVREQWKRIDALFLVARQLRAANRSLNTKRRTKKQEGMAALAPFLREVLRHTNVSRYKYHICHRAAVLFNDVQAGDKATSESALGIFAMQVLETGLIPVGPDGYSGETLRTWYNGMSVEDMLNADKL